MNFFSKRKNENVDRVGLPTVPDLTAATDTMLAIVEIAADQAETVAEVGAKA